MQYKAPRGTYDILPAVSYKWQWVQNCLREMAACYNYKEIVTPIFEVVELFERGVGDGTDIVEKEMYKFTDRKGRVFALRPEGTAPVVRSYLENNLDRESNINKLFYMGPMFRYDRPQAGRNRQFYQYGIELIGSGHPYADAEVILFADMLIRKLGLTKFKLEINSIGCPECSKIYDKAIIKYYQQYKTSLCGDCLKRLEYNPKRLLDCKVEQCRSLSEEAPSVLDYLDDECRKHFNEVCHYLDNLGVKYGINPRIVRGLDYYNRTAFELIDTSRSTQNALLGGGRYDSLIETLGGKKTPAIGFAGGFERLIAAMENEGVSFGNPQKPDVYLITIGETAIHKGIILCSLMRQKGIKVEYDIEKTSLKGQLKAAVKTDTRYALILGDDEVAANRINLKDLKEGVQEIVEIEALIETLKQRLKDQVL